jgi:hypothetical protein
MLTKEQLIEAFEPHATGGQVAFFQNQPGYFRRWRLSSAGHSRAPL